MVKAYDVIAEYYDLEHDRLSDDIQLYLELIRAQGTPVLVLGAGTGRVMEAILSAGYEAWGIDSSMRMLERARVRLPAAGKERLVQADMAEFDLPLTFEVIIAPLDTFAHLLALQSRTSALACIHRHLNPGGLVVLDLSNPHSLPAEDQNGIVYRRFQGVHDGIPLTIWATSHVDSATQRLDLHMTFDALRDGSIYREQDSVHIRWLYRPELELLLRAASLEPLNAYGDYDLRPYATDSPRLIVTATR